MKVNKPQRYPLAERFINILKEGAENVNGELYSVYYHIFMLQDLKELNDVLEQYKELALGNDDYFKSEGEKIWFHVFHKAIRQCDYFKDSYRKGEVELLSKKEQSELTYLRNLVYTEGYKKESDNPKELFNDQYRRYLELHEKKRLEKKERSIGGHLDMILWNTIHVDKKNVLERAMKEVFYEKQR